MTLFLFAAAALAGVLFWNTIAGRFEGDRLERSLRVPIGPYYVHVHHWLYCLGLLALLHATEMAGIVLDGFLVGSAAQGLTYRDWYLLVYEKRRAEEIYARWAPAEPTVSGSDA